MDPFCRLSYHSNLALSESMPLAHLELLFLCGSIFTQLPGTGSCIPLPSLRFPVVAAMWRLALFWVIPLSYVLAAFTDEFLQAFHNLGLEQWTGIEMDVAWGHATLQYGLHRPSITGPIFVYRVCTSLEVAMPSRVQVLTHENLMPEKVLSAIAVYFPDLRGSWTSDAWHLVAIDSTRGHSRDRSLMRLSYVLIHAGDYWTFNQRPRGLVELMPPSPASPNVVPATHSDSHD